MLTGYYKNYNKLVLHRFFRKIIGLQYLVKTYSFLLSSKYFIYSYCIFSKVDISSFVQNMVLVM